MLSWAGQTLRGKSVVAQTNKEYKIWPTNKMSLEEGRGLKQSSTYVILPETGVVQPCDSEHW